MCGIAAILFAPTERPPEVQQEIREIFTRNLLYNEARGKAATGLAVLRSDGQLAVYKAPVPAAQFVQTERYRTMLASLDARTVLWLGHTREPTKGASENNDNNHPIMAGKVVGVHNGHVVNDDALFEAWGYRRQGEVDSEIIFRLLSGLEPHTEESRYAADARLRLKSLEGKFTFLAADVRRPQRLLVLKHHNPLAVHYHAPWGALVFSSRYLFLRKTFGRSVVAETLPHNTLLTYDATRLAELGSKPLHACALG